MPVEGSRDNRRGSMPGSYTPAVKYPAQNERVRIYGIPEREKQSDDIKEIRKHEICIPKPRILVQGILCGYSRKEYKSNKRIYSKSDKTG